MQQGATLTEIAYWSRATIKYGIFFLVFLLLARFIWITGWKAYRQFYPKPPSPPTVSFGKLPSLAFPTAQPNSSALQFSLELPSGELPKITTVVTVYVIQPRKAYLGVVDQARTIAKALRFTNGEEAVSPTVYRFFHDKTDAVLEINIITGTFSISSSLYKNPELLLLRPPSQEAAAANIRNYLTNAKLFPEDFMNGKTAAIYARNENDTLTPAISLSEGQFVRVDFFRQNYDNFQIVTPYPNRSNVWFVVSGATDERLIVGGEYHYFSIDATNTATYPIKTASVAWEELKTGKGVYVSLPSNNSVVVRRVYLAYYDTPEYQEFLQPVFVFEGDNGFIGYVPAVTSDYYGR